MNATLDRLIERFRAAQDNGVAALVEVLQLPLPRSGIEWARYCAENGIHRLRELNGVGIHAHGYGVELKLDGLTIDFDWGPNGEPDGFDGWRLYNFARENDIGVECTHDDVNLWLRAAFRDGALTMVNQLYFDPRRRSGRKAPREVTQIMAGFAEVLIAFLSAESGGRRTAVCLSADGPASYRPHLRVIDGDGEMLGVEFVDGPDSPVAPGESAYATVRFVYQPEVNYDVLTVGARFEVLEGGHVVGTGHVTRR